MRDCVEMVTNEALSLERYLVICYVINVQQHAQKCSYNKNNI